MSSSGAVGYILVFLFVNLRDNTVYTERKYSCSVEVGVVWMVVHSTLCLLGNVNKFFAGNIKILIDLLDKMILPICTYNCEVWGASFFSSKSSPSNFLSEKQCKNPIDKKSKKFRKPYYYRQFKIACGVKWGRQNLMVHQC